MGIWAEIRQKQGYIYIVLGWKMIPCKGSPTTTPNKLLHLKTIPNKLLHLKTTPNKLLHLKTTPNKLLHLKTTPNKLLHLTICWLIVGFYVQKMWHFLNRRHGSFLGHGVYLIVNWYTNIYLWWIVI
jgi:hypothetical protein